MGKLILLLMMLSSPVFAKGYHNAYQTGSYSGMLTGGIGYEFDLFTTQFLLGYVPKVVGGEYLYSATSKNIFHPSACTQVYRCIKPYGGFSILYSILDDDTFIKQPDQYPDKYYPSNGIRVAPLLGMSARVHDQISIYVEVSTLDLYMETYIRSNTDMNIKDITTYGFGITINLRESQ